MKNLLNALKTFRAKNDGATTVEFMFALPLVMFWFAGSFTFFDAYSEYTRSVKATYTVADILSRQTDDVDSGYIENMNQLFANIMGENTNDTWVRVTSLQQGEDNISIQWSDATGMHPELTDMAKVPTEIIPNLVEGESIILVQSYMSFVPFLDYVGIETRTLTNQVVVSPRFAPHLAYNDG